MSSGESNIRNRGRTIALASGSQDLHVPTQRLADRSSGTGRKERLESVSEILKAELSVTKKRPAVDGLIRPSHYSRLAGLTPDRAVSDLSGEVVRLIESQKVAQHSYCIDRAVVDEQGSAAPEVPIEVVPVDDGKRKAVTTVDQDDIGYKVRRESW